MQPVDYTTLMAICADLRQKWLPARIEQVYQRDRYTIALALRTLERRAWLNISWHPQAARISIGTPPPRTPDTFTFSDQLRHQLGGYVLIEIEAIAPWERVIDLQFAKRPGEAPVFHLYVEIMGKYSNVILTDGDEQIITVAYQVTSDRSSVRTVQTGQPYERPPQLAGNLPKLSESKQSWQEKVSLIPGSIKKQLLKTYRGLSQSLAISMLKEAGLDPDRSSTSLEKGDWNKLFQCWQEWLQVLEEQNFRPGWLDRGYNVLGWGIERAVPDIQILIDDYYTAQLDRELFQQLHHQLLQKVTNVLNKLRLKADTFRQRLQQSETADESRASADLLMAHLQAWKPGMRSLTLLDFETNEPITIPLNPEKNAVQNAQALYKLHQKLKRARDAVVPLLQEVSTEIEYLEQVESSLSQLDTHTTAEDLQALLEIREELIGQNYLEDRQQKNRSSSDESKPYIYHTPSGFELWIGRNNRQNDQLAFRIAGDYDLWLHAQEIPGSHALLRLKPGEVPDETDLQFAADLTAYYCRARQSDRVPVVYTESKNVYKLKGAKPGMAIYKQGRVIWGSPQQAVLM
jgi:predicted ribosome quality control (RQC) complex YloA/Tae2 family protein